MIRILLLKKKIIFAVFWGRKKGMYTFNCKTYM